MEDWPNVARIVHVAGGTRVFVDPDSQRLLASPNGSWSGPHIAAYHDLFPTIFATGTNLIGCEFYSYKRQLDGLDEPHWWPLYHTTSGIRTPLKIFQDWSGISQQARQDGKYSAHKRSQIIWTQMRICSWRLFDLSNAYASHLSALCKDGRHSPGTKFDGSFSQFMFISAHAMFSELSSLRDYLASYSAIEIFGLDPRRFDSMPRLLDGGGLETLDHPLSLSIIDAAHWLEMFGHYRNIITHNAPLSSATGGWTEQYLLETSGGPLRQVRLRLPSDPATVREDLRNQSAFSNSSFRLREDYLLETDGPDVLTYCWWALGHLLSLADKVAKHSGIVPTMPVITDEDIIGDVTLEE